MVFKNWKKWAGLSSGTALAALAIPGCQSVQELLKPVLGLVGLA